MYELIVQEDIVNPLKRQRFVIAHVREYAQVESRGLARIYTAVQRVNSVYYGKAYEQRMP